MCPSSIMPRESTPIQEAEVVLVPMAVRLLRVGRPHKTLDWSSGLFPNPIAFFVLIWSTSPPSFGMGISQWKHFDIMTDYLQCINNIVKLSLWMYFYKSTVSLLNLTKADSFSMGQLSLLLKPKISQSDMPPIFPSLTWFGCFCYLSVTTVFIYPSILNYLIHCRENSCCSSR